MIPSTIIILIITCTHASTRQLAPVGDLSIPSSGLRINDNLNLYYETDATKITILVEAKSMGWIGIGFEETMTNCDMVIFNSNSGTVI